MILSLLYTFCMRLGVPVAHNQNQILLKLIIAPASDLMNPCRHTPRRGAARPRPVPCSRRPSLPARCR